MDVDIDKSVNGRTTAGAPNIDIDKRTNIDIDKRVNNSRKTEIEIDDIAAVLGSSNSAAVMGGGNDFTWMRDSIRVVAIQKLEGEVTRNDVHGIGNAARGAEGGFSKGGEGGKSIGGDAEAESGSADARS